MAGPMIAVNTTPRPTGAFNEAAAILSYGMAGELKFNGVNPDEDKTIKEAPLNVSLNAMVAGYKGTPYEANVKQLADMITKYPELKDGAAALLKGEGKEAVGAFTELLTGNGSIDMTEVSKIMEKSPATRKAIGDVMKKVGELDKFGETKMDKEYLVNFIKDGMDASRNQTDEKKVNKFKQTAQDGGIDISGIKNEAMDDILGDFMKDPNKAITAMLAGSGMPDGMKNGLIGLANWFVDFLKPGGDGIGKMIFGGHGEKGLVTAAKEGWQQLSDKGAIEQVKYAGANPNGPAMPQ